MQQNILRDSEVVKIVLFYMVNGVRKKLQVKLRYMDKKEAYFGSEQISYIKPKKKSNIEIACYTSDGIYRSNVTLLDMIESANETLFIVSIPYIWKLSQIRSSSRKKVELPLTIKFNDGFEIDTTTLDISLGGVSFYSAQPIPSVYKQLTAILSLKLPEGGVINFANGKMLCEARYQREKDNGDFLGLESSIMYVFKFLTMTDDDVMVLKDYLLWV